MAPTTVHSEPWWRYGHVWLIISGPAIVVVAALVTAWIAVRSADPVIDADYYRHGLEINKLLAHQRALLPAEHARNHAATPAADPR
ncbi:MAG TPA: FixH family protein [Ramlibacter sp.]|nr:FixH family protein [Ramlibacter sp.]